MAEYIEREAALTALSMSVANAEYDECEEETVKKCMRVLHKVPAADVVPCSDFDLLAKKYTEFQAKHLAGELVEVVHGKWEADIDDDEFWGELEYWKCSLCGTRELRCDRSNYCPNCGAKMDGGKA